MTFNKVKTICLVWSSEPGTKTICLKPTDLTFTSLPCITGLNRMSRLKCRTSLQRERKTDRQLVAERGNTQTHNNLSKSHYINCIHTCHSQKKQFSLVVLRKGIMLQQRWRIYVPLTGAHFLACTTVPYGRCVKSNTNHKVFQYPLPSSRILLVSGIWTMLIIKKGDLQACWDCAQWPNLIWNISRTGFQFIIISMQIWTPGKTAKKKWALLPGSCIVFKKEPVKSLLWLWGEKEWGVLKRNGQREKKGVRK